MTALLATIHSNVDLEALLGILIVVGCLIAAAVFASRSAWIAVLCFIAVAIVAAALLL